MFREVADMFVNGGGGQPPVRNQNIFFKRKILLEGSYS